MRLPIPYFLLLTFLICGYETFSQCANVSSYGNGMLGSSIGSSDSISCSFASDYGTWAGISSGYNYVTTSSKQTDFITIRSGSPNGTVVAYGFQPLNWTAVISGMHYIHINTDAACGTEELCREITTTNDGYAAPCTQPAIAGSVTASIDVACPNVPFTLSLSGASVGTGLSYQWQASSDGVTYNSINGASSFAYTTQQTVATYYRCIVTCAAGTAATSTSLQIEMGTCTNMSTTSIVTCNGNFYDSGGGLDNYSNNERDTLTIIPSIQGAHLQVIFNYFDVETDWDEMTVFNGNSTTSPLMGTFSVNPGAITSSASDGSLTFVFASDDEVSYAGWEAKIGCITSGPPNDMVCSPITIPVDGSVNYYTNATATVETNEVNIAPPSTGFYTSDGWGLSSLEHTVWFTFEAPLSGNIEISCTDKILDGQVAVYEANLCSDYSSFQLIGANDNDLSENSEAPRFTLCGLTPGQTYYLLYDSGNGYASGPFSIAISEIALTAGTSGEIIDVCSGATIDLYDGIEGYDSGGTWLETIPTFGLNGSTWNTSGVAYQQFEFLYIIENGCFNDTSIAQVKVFGPSRAGNDGTISACKQETINLLSGLSGSVDLGGIWYDPANEALPGNIVATSSIPGQFNFDYVASNGICPNDTANILVIVSDCIASIEDMDMGQFTIYPNPTNGIFFIDMPFESLDSIELYDMNGRSVHFVSSAETNKTRFEVIHPESGFYVLQYLNRENKYVKKLIIN
jgi:hypothetical protein